MQSTPSHNFLSSILNVIGAIILGAIWMTYAALVVFLAILLFVPIASIGGRRVYQKWISEVVHFYWGQMMWGVERWGRVKISFSGDDIPMRETAIIIANHRWGFDWMMLFTLAARKGRLGVCKFFAKSSVRWIPGIGWGIWLLGFPFLARNWTNDNRTITETFRTFSEMRLPFWLVSHLEGTRFSASKKKKSQEFARKKNLPILDHILLPRAKGFQATVKAMREGQIAQVVYDVTFMYEDGHRVPSIGKLLYRGGGNVHIHVRRYPLASLPVGDDELYQWLLKRWEEKDELIRHFMDHGKFPQQINSPFAVEPLLLA